MPRYFFFFFLLLALVFTAPVLAADKPSGGDKVARGGLVCRSVVGQHGQSCDALCAKVEMACTGIQSAGRSPALACGNAIDDTIAPFPVCRCCAVGH